MTPCSSSGLYSALVRSLFRFGGCLVDNRGLFLNALLSRGHFTLFIRFLTWLKSMVRLGLLVITSGIISEFCRFRVQKVVLIFGCVNGLVYKFLWTVAGDEECPEFF